ncbi:MAG TPA: DUF429 domain-containing protein [Anaerolineales bacterium]
MLFTDAVYVGIDPASGRKAFSYAALDRDLNLVTLADGEMEDLSAFLAGQPSAVVAVNAPARVNCGLVRKKLESESLTPGQHQIRGADIRLAEYELRERGILIAGTPSRKELCAGWIQAGFGLYEKLSKMGFIPYPAGDASHQWLETNPHACFCVMLEQIPLAKSSLEGRLQRQLVLYDRGVRLKDAWLFFEEITRYKLLKGHLPLEQVYSAEMLDVLAAAYTAWLAAHHPDKISHIGETEEGEVTLPGTLKSKY